jgi:hypothetical protein
MHSTPFCLLAEWTYSERALFLPIERQRALDREGGRTGIYVSPYPICFDCAVATISLDGCIPAGEHADEAP